MIGNYAKGNGDGVAAIVFASDQFKAGGYSTIATSQPFVTAGPLPAGWRTNESKYFTPIQVMGHSQNQDPRMQAKAFLTPADFIVNPPNARLALNLRPIFSLDTFRFWPNPRKLLLAGNNYAYTNNGTLVATRSVWMSDRGHFNGPLWGDCVYQGFDCLNQFYSLSLGGDSGSPLYYTSAPSKVLGVLRGGGYSAMVARAKFCPAPLRDHTLPPPAAGSRDPATSEVTLPGPACAPPNKLPLGGKVTINVNGCSVLRGRKIYFNLCNATVRADIRAFIQRVKNYQANLAASPNAKTRALAPTWNAELAVLNGLALGACKAPAARFAW
jgi:hypothetical protein